MYCEVYVTHMATAKICAKRVYREVFVAHMATGRNPCHEGCNPVAIVHPLVIAEFSVPRLESWPAGGPGV